MPWSNWDFNQSDPLFEGQIATAYPNGLRNYVNNVLGTVLPFGRMAVLNVVSGLTKNIQATLPSAAGQIQLGVVSVLEQYENDQDPNGNYGVPINRAFNALAKGEIAVVSEVAVNVGDPVYFRYAVRTGYPNLGAFGNTADDTGSGGSHVYHCDLIQQAQWKIGAVAGGIGVITLNLP